MDLLRKLNSFRFVAKDTVDQDLMPIESNISFFKGVFEESKTDKFVKIKMPKLFNHYTLKGLGDGVENIVKKKNEIEPTFSFYHTQPIHLVCSRTIV